MGMPSSSYALKWFKIDIYNLFKNPMYQFFHDMTQVMLANPMMTAMQNMMHINVVKNLDNVQSNLMHVAAGAPDDAHAQMESFTKTQNNFIRQQQHMLLLWSDMLESTKRANERTEQMVDQLIEPTVKQYRKTVKQNTPQPE